MIPALLISTCSGARSGADEARDDGDCVRWRSGRVSDRIYPEGKL